jgi:hypothetical protein
VSSPSSDEAIARDLRAALARKELGAIVREGRRAVAALERPRFTSGDVADARASYRRTHWGLEGTKDGVRAFACADSRVGVFAELGHLVSVVYRADKWGDAPGTEYEHEFGRRKPLLLYSDGGLIIAGGAYRVTFRGIVG